MIQQSTKAQKEIEKQEFDELYQYVKKEILLYDDNQSLSKQMVLRLKGLKDGKHMANNKTKSYAAYTFKIVLNAFKICKASIMSAISYKSFNNEYGKFLYVCAIVENEINDVYLRMKRAEETKEKIDAIELNAIQGEEAEYKKQDGNKNIIGDKLANLW